MWLRRHCCAATETAVVAPSSSAPVSTTTAAMTSPAVESVLELRAKHPYFSLFPSSGSSSAPRHYRIRLSRVAPPLPVDRSRVGGEAPRTARTKSEAEVEGGGGGGGVELEVKEGTAACHCRLVGCTPRSDAGEREIEERGV